MVGPAAVTFADLANPVLVVLTEGIVPVPPVVRPDLCTVFVVIVVVWLPKVPV